MKTLGVSVVDYISLLVQSQNITSDLLYFDKIIICNEFDDSLLNHFINAPINQIHKEFMQTLEILEKHNLIEVNNLTSIQEDIRTASDTSELHEYLRGASQSAQFLDQVHRDARENKLLVTTRDADFDLQMDYFFHQAIVSQFANRMYCSVMNAKSQDQFTPIISTGLNELRILGKEERTDVVRVVLNNFPKIDPKEDIKKLVEFKADKDSKLKLDKLRNWVADIEQDNYSPKQIQGKIEFMLHDYADHLKKHKMVSLSGIIETIVIPSAVLLATFKDPAWAFIGYQAFQFWKQDVILAEGEKDAEGKEIAYIHKAQIEFLPK